MSFQHEEEVELPERCQEFFEAFSREKNGAGSFPGEASDVAAEAEGAEGGGTGGMALAVTQRSAAVDSPTGESHVWGVSSMWRRSQRP